MTVGLTVGIGSIFLSMFLIKSQIDDVQSRNEKDYKPNILLSFIKSIPFFSISALICAVISFILVCNWAQNSNNDVQIGFLGSPDWFAGGDGLFSWHPVLMVSGFFFSQVLALSSWSIIPTRHIAKKIHVLFQFSAIATVLSTNGYKYNTLSLDDWRSYCRFKSWI